MPSYYTKYQVRMHSCSHKKTSFSDILKVECLFKAGIPGILPKMTIKYCISLIAI